MIAIFIIYTILNVIWCLILTPNISVNYVHIFLKLNKIIIRVIKKILVLLVLVLVLLIIIISSSSSIIIIIRLIGNACTVEE